MRAFATPGRTGPALFVCLAVIALAAAAFVVAARQSALAVDVPRLTRSFTPAEGERARIGIRAREDETRARVTILDPSRSEVAVVADGVELAADRIVRLSWDGRDAAGEVVEPGRYKLRIELPGAGRDATWIRGVRVERPDRSGRDRAVQE